MHGSMTMDDGDVLCSSLDIIDQHQPAMLTQQHHFLLYWGLVGIRVFPNGLFYYETSCNTKWLTIWSHGNSPFQPQLDHKERQRISMVDMRTLLKPHLPVERNLIKSK